MKKNSLKLAQKGGMMIEALAMLGLIAVVTPTMYKKSAERTLEVEDINTATTMRSVMTAADSYVSSHYGELIQEISANSTNNTSKALSISDLQPYLPYGFNADKLYDFGEPQVSVVRNGNNLTSFVLFPAKEDGENGLGQERTVRIATLVGANGGYVNGNQTAKGIGGIWNLNKTDFQTVFGSTDEKKPEVYSIVTASSDAINNTNTEEDTDKFLYRTAANGLWHNTMRADLYMGGNTDEHDGYDAGTPKSQPFSIRNIKSLIVGTEFAGSEADTDTGDYGLYISKDADNPNAYIYGTLEAAINSNNTPNFKVTNESIQGAATTEIKNGSTLNRYNFTLDTNNLQYGYNLEDYRYLYDKEYNFTVDKYGNIRSRGSTKLSNSKDGKWFAVEIGLLQSSDAGSAIRGYLFDGKYNSGSSNAEKGAGRVSLVNENTFVVKGKKRDVSGNYNIDYADRIVLANDGIKGDSEGWNKTISYNKLPVFPVRVGSNAKVDGILATAQLDTQNIRAATLEVGSANIDDANKWLKVDASGIHGRQPIDDNNVATGMDISGGKIKFATGLISNGKNAGSNWSTSNGAQSYIGISNNSDGIDIETTEQLDIFENNSNSTGKLTIRNPIVQEQIAGTDVVFSSLQQNPDYSTNVKIKKTNFEVSDEDDNRVFAVRGNTKSEDNKLKSAGGFDVAVHGNTVFTPQGVEQAYLTVGHEYANNIDKTGVAISKSSDDGISNAMYIDVGANSVSRNRPVKNESEGQIKWNMNNTYYAPGTVYVRKGMVEVLPGKPNINAAGKGLDSATSGNGFISAGRFVANNLDKNGKELEVPKFVNYGSNKVDKEVATYAQYNGDGASNPYDTYMVNPAYTSVMHDIKLTTRGGARLSDILPDFINKGIYITSNTYLDNIESMSFKFDGTSVVPTSGTATSEQSTITLGSENSWASPYLGFVPAPQCPPGYNRVITMAPQSFMMAQAGQMQRGSNPRLGTNGAYYVKNQVPDSTAFDHYTDTVTQNGAYVQQAFVKPTVSKNTDVTINGTTHAGAAKTQGTELSGVSDQNSAQTATYFLASFGDKTVPLTIQQSTWLKTNVIPVGKKNQSYAIGSNIASDDYVLGWAALMGFVYDAATYQTVIDKLAGDLHYNDGNNNVYWNVFPVRRNTLEAYATTYCYFDRNGILNDLDDNAGKYVDHYNALNDYKGNNTYDKHRENDDAKGIKGNSGYLERLNDPALKYDEVW